MTKQPYFEPTDGGGTCQYPVAGTCDPATWVDVEGRLYCAPCKAQAELSGRGWHTDAQAQAKRREQNAKVRPIAAARESGLCGCGCGDRPGKPTSLFLPGHDAKLKGKIRRGEVKEDQLATG